MMPSVPRDDLEVTTAHCAMCGASVAAGSTCAQCGTVVEPSPTERHAGASRMHAAEWSTLTFAPFWVFNAVAGADGKLRQKELTALQEVIQRVALTDSPLLDEVLAQCRKDLDGMLEAWRTDGRTFDVGLTQIRQILDRRVEMAQAAAFKRGLLSIGRRVASANGTGLFGLGTKLSRESREALSLVHSFLDMPADEMPQGL
jgi:hypothetical protein